MMIRASRIGRPGALFALLLLWLAAVGTAFAGEPSEEDRATERSLKKGRVVSMKEIGTGVTRPKKVELTYEGETAKAAFKDVNFSKPLARLGDGTVEAGFTDSYRYEPAAYLLARRLGIQMVPVAVTRSIGGKPGALIAWIDGAMTEKERRAEQDEVGADLEIQQDLMEIFDALIANVDRNLGNQLITRADGRLYLIDHSRAFREDTELTDRFLARDLQLTRELHAALQSLEYKELRSMLKSFLKPKQIKSLLVRRDAILQKIEIDMQNRGDSVFCDCLHLH